MAEGEKRKNQQEVTEITQVKHDGGMDQDGSTGRACRDPFLDIFLVETHIL